jgi:diguanylate cyclase (GGDEF)-like protein/PAS domain S-box-containing protein
MKRSLDLGGHAQAHSLRESEERFRWAFDEAPIGMLILDLEGNYERINDAFCAIVGYDRDWLLVSSREEITHPDDVDADAAAARLLLAGSATSRSYEKRYLHAAGHTVWTSFNLTLARDDEGRALRFIAQVQDITEQRSYELQLEHMVDHDALTGLLNRRAFQCELESHLRRIERYGVAGAILMIDLDNFKYFNDSQGHAAGDRLIVRIAQSLQSRLREAGILARLGGDEFAVLLPNGDERATQHVADALLQVVRELPMPAPIERHKSVTASIGIARFDDGPHLTAEEMMVNADLAMYGAKEAGRDRAVRYRNAWHEHPQIEGRIKWVDRINEAICRDGFELLAQPIVPLFSGGETQYELLLRMRTPEGQLIEPASFLDVAERLGLIGEIDRWVTDRAIEILAEQQALGRNPRFEINLSALSIGDEELLELIEGRLRATGIAPDRLIFEITETAALAHVGRAIRFVERLSALGCGFALDDFGAGFGSFYYLKHLPCGYLKIDGEFVQHCARSETDRLLIAAAVQIARGMGKRTIAEFVGDRETVEVLTGLGVDYGQGFHLGVPAPLSEHLAEPAIDARRASISA